MEVARHHLGRARHRLDDGRVVDGGAARRRQERELERGAAGGHALDGERPERR